MPARMDHVADANGVELKRLSLLYEFPPFVKSANLEQVMRQEPRDRAVYADPRFGQFQFPCDTAADTWLSVLYFNEKRAEFHPKDQQRIQERLDHYVRFWRIEPSVDRLLKKAATYHAEKDAALPDSAYAYVWVDDATGRKERHLRLTNAQEVKAAAEYLETYRDRFTFIDRNTMAKKIMEKAAKFGAGVKNREFLEKQAGMGVCDPAKVVAMLEDRSRLAQLPPLKAQLLKMAACVRDQPRQALQPDMLIELAKTVDDVDRGLKLYGRYTDGIPRPEDVIFEATFSKAASDLADHVGLTSGKVYKRADLAKIPLGAVESLFGADFAGEVKGGLDKVDAEKMAELVSALPRPDAELLDRLMAECGLQPQLLKAASVRQGFSPQDLEKLAAGYAASLP